MLKQIFRYIKPQHIELQFKKQTISRNILTANKLKCYSFNLKSASSATSTSTKSVFIDNENTYAYTVLKKISAGKSSSNKKSYTNVTSVEQFNEILDQNWRDSSIGEVVDTFLKVKEFCILNNITVADSRFDKLVDGVIDNCEHISDEELITLLYCLSEFPQLESYTAHNYHDLWSCLDDVCCWKIVDWDIDKCLIVANAWYQLQLGRLCDYIFILIDRFVKKAEKLTKEQLVSVYFYLNICRKRAVDFEYEFALEKLINDMDIDEMAIVAMGYFKTKTKIKLVTIQEAMVKKVIQNTKTVHEISLTAILKILRYSKPIKLYQTIQIMTEKLCPEIDRLSDLCCTHLALMSTGIQVYNKTIFQNVSEKFIKKIQNVDLIRIKDIERILNALTMFNYDPKTEPDIFKASLNELSNDKRRHELKKHPRCLICSMNFLSLRNIYSYDLLNQVLDMEYIETNFGKGAKSIPRELFVLDSSIDIDCPGYTGNRLVPIKKYKTAKWMVDYIPSHDQWKKHTAFDKLFLDAVDTVKNILSNEKLMYITHILPHFSRADIILCKNEKTGAFIEPIGFENYTLGDVMVPFNDGSLEWFAIVILGWNNTIKDTKIPLGHSVMKERQLKKIGYKPVFIYWNEFNGLDDSKKKKYISNKLK